MKHFVIDDDNLELLSKSNSLGNQQKWRNIHDGSFIKGALFNCVEWRDYLSECIGSAIASQIQLPGFRYAEYEECTYTLNGKEYKGCWSPNFLREGESLITLFSAMQKHVIDWEAKDSIAELYAQLSNIFLQATGKLQTEYLSALFAIDFLIGNTDRHLRNFALIKNSITNEVYPAPAFDFGMGLFQGSYQLLDETAKRRILKIKYLPFNTSFSKALSVYNAQYDISSLLPEPIKLEGYRFPDIDSMALLATHAKMLNRHIEGVI